MLGIHLGISDVEGRDVQYEGIVRDIQRTLRFWRMRTFKLRGKVLVVNGLIMSTLVYVMNVLDVPDRVLKKINSLVSYFICDGKGLQGRYWKTNLKKGD